MSNGTDFVDQVFKKQKQKDDTTVIEIVDGTKQIEDRDDFDADMFFQQNNFERKNSIALMNKPTVYNLENELHHAKKPPCWIILFLLGMILAVGGIYSIMSFLSMEDSIFYICIFDYYIISAIIIGGFIRVFYGFFSIMLV